jgi:hypothetical protein
MQHAPDGQNQSRRCPMNHQHDPALVQYPHGRGYGHDYMRGGEVLGGYGYAERDEYARSRGELEAAPSDGMSDGEGQEEAST